MAPGFLKELRRRSRASFRTEHSTDTSSEGAVSHGTALSSGSVTPPSVAQQSDPALNLQLKRNSGSQSPQLPQSQSRPTLVNASTNSSRYSVSGMSGLGSPSSNGKQNLPVSPYAPRVHNLTENAWVCCTLTPDPDQERQAHLLAGVSKGSAYLWQHRGASYRWHCNCQ